MINYNVPIRTQEWVVDVLQKAFDTKMAELMETQQRIEHQIDTLYTHAGELGLNTDIMA